MQKSTIRPYLNKNMFSCICIILALFFSYLAPSFDRDDPFLATDPRPRSGSGTDRKFKRINSWDEPSIGTQSESELTPRSRSGSSEQQMKNGRRGSKKKKVNPSPPKVEIETKKDRGLFAIELELLCRFLF